MEISYPNRLYRGIDNWECVRNVDLRVQVHPGEVSKSLEANDYLSSCFLRRAQKDSEDFLNFLAFSESL